MAEQDSLQFSNLFADGGELLRRVAQEEPGVEVRTMAMDSELVRVREDSFQIKGLKGGKFEIHGVFVDGAQIWNHPDALAEAEANIFSVYNNEPGPTRLLRPLFDRALAVRYGLRKDIVNHGIRTRVSTDSDGSILDYQTDVVGVRIDPMTHRQCGELIVSSAHGQVVREASAAVMQHFGFEQENLLQLQDDEEPGQAYERISILSQNAFANLINATFADNANGLKQPWIYKATSLQRSGSTVGTTAGRTFYTDQPLNHFHIQGLYCKISPAFREFVALATQSLARYYMAGGSPDDVNQDVLHNLIAKINDGYRNESLIQAELQEQRLLQVA